MDWMNTAKMGFEPSGDTQRLFAEFYYAAKSWTKQRRVIARIEHMEKGANPHYTVTNLAGSNIGSPTLEGIGRHLYETLYCARADMENRINEQQVCVRGTPPNAC